MEDLRAEPCVLLKFGELALKGRNRPRFVGALERNLRRLTSAEASSSSPGESRTRRSSSAASPSPVSA